MQELIDFRNTLIREINAGWYDALSWQACAVWAREIGCSAIQAQVEGYIRHYGGHERWLNAGVVNR